MKSAKFTLFFMALISLAMGSCTLEKKRYSFGYHVEWKIFNKGNKNESTGKTANLPKHTHNAVPQAVEANNETADGELPGAVTAEAFASQPEEATITFSRDVAAETKYFKKEQKKAEKSARAADQKKGESKATKFAQKLSKATAALVGDNQLVATLLAFFLGTFAIHRFYLGYTGIAIVQLSLLLVGMGLYIAGIMSLSATSTITIPIVSFIGIGLMMIEYIWVFSDFWRIVFGRLQPNGDSYRKAFYK